MTAKEFLNEVRRKGQEIAAAELEIQQEEFHAYHVSSPPFGDKVQSNATADLSAVITRLASRRAELAMKIAFWVEEKRKARGLIEKEPDTVLRALLVRRYLTNQKWEAIAEQMGYDLRWIHRMHCRALRDMEIEWAKLAIKSH